LGRPELSVVIPVYNEEARIGKTLAAAFVYLRKKKTRAEILVVDDGSKDKTLETVGKFKKLAKGRLVLKILKHGVNRGKGAAVKTGALAARGDTILYMDADNATALSEFEHFRPALREGADVIVGSRAVDRKAVKVHQPIYREAMGRIFNYLVRLITVSGVKDTQCGFKAFRREAANAIFPLQTIERFGFDVELLYIARKHGFTIDEISVQWFDALGSKVNVLRDSTRMFTDLLLIRWNDMKGLYSSKKAKAVSHR